MMSSTKKIKISENGAEKSEVSKSNLTILKPSLAMILRPNALDESDQIYLRLKYTERD